MPLVPLIRANVIPYHRAAARQETIRPAAHTRTQVNYYVLAVDRHRREKPARRSQRPPPLRGQKSVGTTSTATPELRATASASLPIRAQTSNTPGLGSSGKSSGKSFSTPRERCTRGGPPFAIRARHKTT